MKGLLPILLFLTSALPTLSASADPTTQALFTDAMLRANLFHDQNSPLQLDVDFVAQINVPSQGHLSLKWKAKDQWWRKITMGDFEQLDVRNGSKLYTSRNAPFTPFRITQLIGLLNFAQGAEGLTVNKQKLRKENGIEILCLRVKSGGKDHDVCINPASREILSDEWQDPPDEKRATHYSDYADFQGHRYPRNLQLAVNGIKVITASITSVTNLAFEQSLLGPPAGAIERQQCADMKHPVPIKTPDPAYPRSASENRMSGDTTVAMTVLTDGSVTDIQLIGSAAHSMDEATLATLKGWKFKPAMCGADPVVSDIQVVVSFRLR